MERLLREGAFEGETHIVTGASQGIGNAIATALAVHGACVALVDLDAEKLGAVRDEIAREAPVAPLVIPANVTSEQEVADASADQVGGMPVVSEAAQYLGRVGVNGAAPDEARVAHGLWEPLATGTTGIRRGFAVRVCVSVSHFRHGAEQVGHPWEPTPRYGARTARCHRVATRAQRNQR